MDQWIDDTGAQLSIDKATGKPIERPSLAAQEWIEHISENPHP